MLRHILLDIEYWNESDDLDRESLIYHELGHCILNREHNDFVIVYTDGRVIKKSIMNAYLFSEYRKYRSYYIYELFHPHLAPEDLMSYVKDKLPSDF